MIFYFVSDIEQNIMVFLKFTKRIGTKHLKMKQRNVEKSEEQRQNKNLRGPEKMGRAALFCYRMLWWEPPTILRVHR